MNEFIFQLALVFIPGLTWASIVDTITVVGGKRSTFAMVLRAFGFGITAYFIYFVGLYTWHRCVGTAPPTLIEGIQSAGVEDLHALRPGDILGATLVAPPLAIGWSFAANRKWFLRLMQKIRVTRKFGDESVWDFTFNMGIAGVEYVNVRDFENRVIYTGYVKAFSDGGKARELLLERAVVYELDSGQLLYEMPLIYLSRKPDALHVEYPYKPVPALVAPAASPAAPAPAPADTPIRTKSSEG